MALTDSPEQFPADVTAERRLTGRHWQARIDHSVWMIVRDRTEDGNKIVGLARLTREAPHPDVRHLESVWVHPDYRLRHIGRQLVEKLKLHARRDGVRVLKLWVFDTNLAAYDTYLKLGFSETGERQPINTAHGVEIEVRMKLDLF